MENVQVSSFSLAIFSVYTNILIEIEHVRSIELIEVYTDGATNEKLGVSGAGVYIKVNGQTYEYSYSLPKMSNHEAEFTAVLKALEICEEKFPNEILSFQTDSQIVVNAIEKSYVKNALFKPLLTEIMEKAATFPYLFIKWIPSKQNLHADRLAKKAIYMQK